VSSYVLELPSIRFNVWRWSPSGGVVPSGRRLVILHGVTANAMAFGGVARALASHGCTVDAIDLPGHGGTRWTDEAGQPLSDQESVGRSAYDLRHVGELVAAAMRAIPPRSCVQGRLQASPRLPQGANPFRPRLC
jgi:alpha-beta hydrolase superfamily lysophospholipase